MFFVFVVVALCLSLYAALKWHYNRCRKVINQRVKKHDAVVLHPCGLEHGRIPDHGQELATKAALAAVNAGIPLFIPLGFVYYAGKPDGFYYRDLVAKKFGPLGLKVITGDGGQAQTLGEQVYESVWLLEKHGISHVLVVSALPSVLRVARAWHRNAAHITASFAGVLAPPMYTLREMILTVWADLWARLSTRRPAAIATARKIL